MLWKLAFEGIGRSATTLLTAIYESIDLADHLQHAKANFVGQIILDMKVGIYDVLESKMDRFRYDGLLSFQGWT